MIINSFQHFCFDLDGTLVDSSKTIFEATAYTLDKLGINFNVTEKDFAEKIGQHFQDIFDSFNINVPDFNEFLDIYKENYFQQMNHSHLYDEVEVTLAGLKEKGAKISLLTTKAQDQADKIIDYFGFRKYFDFVMGRREGFGHKPSAEPLIFICNNIKVDVKNTLIVGDTELDIQCGKNAGSNTCAVLYGYRNRDLLEGYKPDYLISSLRDLLKLI